jgi:hypothetical protein
MKIYTLSLRYWWHTYTQDLATQVVWDHCFITHQLPGEGSHLYFFNICCPLRSQRISEMFLREFHKRCWGGVCLGCVWCTFKYTWIYYRKTPRWYVKRFISTSSIECASLCALDITILCVLCLMYSRYFFWFLNFSSNWFLFPSLPLKCALIELIFLLLFSPLPPLSLPYIVHANFRQDPHG